MLSLLPLLFGGCAAAEVDPSATSDQAVTSDAGVLVPETARTASVVLANPDGFAGTNQLHYRFLKGLFADGALGDVKVRYVSPFAFGDLASEARAADGDRITARFSARFRTELESGRVTSIDASIDSPWARDFFPMLARDARGKLRAVRFAYSNTPAAGPEAETVAKNLGYEVETSDLILEGGNVMVDDEKTLFTTTKVLKKNPGKSKEQIEAELRRVLGVTSVEWLEPLPQESTGHVDIFAKIVGKKRVIVSSSDFACGDESSAGCRPRQPVLDAAAKAFERRGYTVTRIKNAEVEDDAKALTYANSLLVNGTAFVPEYFDPSVADSVDFMEGETPIRTMKAECATLHPFGATEDAAYEAVKQRAACLLRRVVAARPDETKFQKTSLDVMPRDAEARAAYARLGYRVVSIPGANMIQLGGSVHCLSMQLAK
jgi:agmatine/peptidylarginine deiminase